jgi:hypothetical protein
MMIPTQDSLGYKDPADNTVVCPKLLGHIPKGVASGMQLRNPLFLSHERSVTDRDAQPLQVI